MEIAHRLTSANSEARPRRTSEEMFPLIEWQSQSNLSQKDYCKAQGISPWVFSYWRKKYLQEQSNDSGFTELTASDSTSGWIRLQYGRVRLELSDSVPVVYLADLIRELD